MYVLKVFIIESNNAQQYTTVKLLDVLDDSIKLHQDNLDDLSLKNRIAILDIIVLILYSGF